MENQQGFGSGEIASEFGQSPSKPTDIRTIVARFIIIALSLLSIIFIALLIYAGYKYMTAAGNEDQVSEAKKQITQSIIGLVIILTAYSITYFVLRNIENATTASFYMPT